MKVSISQLKCFKSCRRQYELKYKYEVEPVEKAEALEIGSNYHELIEKIHESNRSIVESVENDFSKELAMARAYERYIYPKIDMKSVEEWQSYDLGDGDELIGRVDGIASDGNLVEHKTTGSTNLDEYEYGLQWDEQILAYMLMTGARKIYYTICRKPNIKQKKGESDEQFFYRMVSWYDDDTNNKIRLVEIYRTDDEVEQFKNDLKMMISEMKHCADSDAYYKNTNHCTCWGRRCEYSPICLNYDPNEEYVEFKRKENIRNESTKV